MPSLTPLPQAAERVPPSPRWQFLNPFRRDYERYEGVPRINIYLLRVLFALMFVFLSFDSWQHIFAHAGPWETVNAAAWCMWGAYAIISFIGVLRPLKMLPIVLFEVIYKVTWLLIVAYPLWTKNALAGSPAEYTAQVFIWVIVPALIMPWGYFFRTYLLGKKMA